jgi:hypothetical protein
MHEMALMRAEIQDLREANEILIWRRRAKRTRLQNRGKINIEEGSDLVDQVDVNTQIMAESSRSGGQGSSARPRVRRCGLAARPDIMQGPVRRVLRPLEMSTVTNFN